MAEPYIHPSAIIDQGAVLEDDVKIWHFCHVMGDTRIGRGSILGQNCFVAGGVEVGAGCKIQNNVSLYNGVILEDQVFCGPSMVFTNVHTPRAFVERKEEFLPTRVKRGASLGANSTILCGHTIGEYAFVAAGAVITKDVPAYALMVGVPARLLGWVSRLGRVLGDDLCCPESGEHYRLHEGVLVPVE